MSYNPVNFKNFEKEALKDPKVRIAYEELEEEFALFAEMIKARKMAQKTQKDVAKQMHTSQAAIARIESGFGQKKYSPTLNTLKRYAKALGCQLTIKFIPEHSHHTVGTSHP